MIKLVHGDCLDVLQNVPDNYVDLVLTDPPYGITACKWDTIIPFEALWKQLKRITKPNSAIIMMASQPFTSMLIMSNLEMFKYCWVWKKNIKTGFLNAKKQPLRQTEDIVVFYNTQCVYNPQKTGGHLPVHSYTKRGIDGDTLGKTKAVSGGGQNDRYPSNILEMKTVSGKRLHPSQKPIDLMDYFIKTYSNENDVVLDFSMGSGTTGVSCKNLNRSFIGIELNRKYFDKAKIFIKTNKYR